MRKGKYFRQDPELNEYRRRPEESIESAWCAFAAFLVLVLIVVLSRL